MIEMSPDGQSAQGNMLLTLAEASGAKNGWGMSSNDLGTLEGLSNYTDTSDPLYPLARDTVARLSVFRCPAGPVSLGGSGIGTPSSALLAGYALEGAKPPSGRRKTKLGGLRKAAIEGATVDCPKGGQDVEEVLREVDYDEMVRNRLYAEPLEEKAIRNYKTHREAGKRREAKGRKALETSNLLTVLKGSELSALSKRKARQILLRDPNALKEKTRKRLAKALKGRLKYTVLADDVLYSVVPQSSLRADGPEGRIFQPPPRERSRYQDAAKREWNSVLDEAENSITGRESPLSREHGSLLRRHVQLARTDPHNTVENLSGRHIAMIALAVETLRRTGRLPDP
jgi:hypothetical protein